VRLKSGGGRGGTGESVSAAMMSATSAVMIHTIERRLCACWRIWWRRRLMVIGKDPDVLPSATEVCTGPALPVWRQYDHRDASATLDRPVLSGPGEDPILVPLHAPEANTRTVVRGADEFNAGGFER
jgi:hypothetical protein